jgi:nucleoid DNA-binding protein
MNKEGNINFYNVFIEFYKFSVTELDMSGKIVKDDLAREYAVYKNITIKEARERIDDVTELIARNLASGNNVKIMDFFNFSVKERRAKKGVSLATGEPTIIPATKTVVARMSQSLKERIQGKR